MRIYTRRGDDGTTGLYLGGRIRKDEAGPEAYGTVDEAVAALGVARAELDDTNLADQILMAQRDLFVVAAELATETTKADRLEPGVSRVSQDMIDRLETAIDDLVSVRGLPEGFVVPGQDRAAAALDLARSVVRRAERRAVTHMGGSGGASLVVPYLNRMADYLYVLARAHEPEWEPSREQES